MGVCGGGGVVVDELLVLGAEGTAAESLVFLVMGTRARNQAVLTRNQFPNTFCLFLHLCGYDLLLDLYMID